MKKFKVIALAAAMVMVGATVALAAVSWPAKTTTFNGVNNYLNALHQTDLNQFSQAKVVSATLAPSGGSTMEGSVQCPGWSPTTVGWYATGGSITRSDIASVDGDYYVSMSGPTTQMGTNQPNGWKVNMSNPTWNGIDPLPTDLTVYAVCVT